MWGQKPLFGNSCNQRCIVTRFRNSCQDTYMRRTTFRCLCPIRHFTTVCTVPWITMERCHSAKRRMPVSGNESLLVAFHRIGLKSFFVPSGERRVRIVLIFRIICQIIRCNDSKVNGEWSTIASSAFHVLQRMAYKSMCRNDCVLFHYSEIISHFP